MQITRTQEETRTARAGLGSTALVPTMGALHAGHLSLIRHARTCADHVTVSIFVNPTQFAPHEDLSRYPRPIEKDLALCEAEGVDLVFCPEVETLYPKDELELSIDVPALTCILEGTHRPGHFIGVCRVVAKLFHILNPDTACFGQKDLQQLRVIEAMTAGLDLPIRIAACPTVREPDGLAMSSRNIYLDANQRRRALAISRTLHEAAERITRKDSTIDELESRMRGILTEQQLDVDYAVVRHARTLTPITSLKGEIACLIAARVDQIRLIDNCLITL